MRKSETRIYKIWTQMKNRCLNENHSRYHVYGGKGISFDDKWSTFDGFYQDMKDGYRDDLTLDRIDLSKGYTKENCRWATYEEQNNNRSCNLNLEHDGVKITVKEISKHTGLSIRTIYSRLESGWSVEKIMTTPKLTQGEYYSKRNSKAICILDVEEGFEKEFKSIAEASRVLNVSYDVLKNIRKGKTSNKQYKIKDI